MMVSNWLFLVVLVLVAVRVVGQNTSVYYFMTFNDTNSNRTTLDSYLNQNSSTCNSAPTSRLNLCNNTCVTCLAGDSSKCATCDVGYYLDGVYCIINNTNYNYSYTPYIGTTVSEANSTITQFRYTSSNATVPISRVASICRASTYEIEVAGVFFQTDVVNLQFFRTDPIDQIQIKLNFMSLVSSIAFYISLNDNLLFSKNFPAMSDLSGITVENYNSSDRSFLTLDALAINTANSIFSPIDTNLINYTTSQYTIKFYVKTNATKNHVWAFNDMVLLQRDCQTCVSKAVRDLMQSTSLAVLFTLITVVVLVIILCMAMVYEQYQRKKEFQEKLGSTSGNLPVKAIERVIDAVKKAQKTREKEMNKEARDYHKIIKEQKQVERKEEQYKRLSIGYQGAASKVHSISQLDLP